MATEDFIRISGLKIFGHHGVYTQEKEQGQYFYINADLFYDIHLPGKTDLLSHALNYADCCHYIAKVFTEKNFDLIEAAAEELSRRLLLHYPVLRKVSLEVCKPHAPIGMPFDNVSVHITRSWHTVYISFGSNMGDREGLIREGIAELGRHPDIWELVVSKCVETKPYGPIEQNNFLNGVLKLETLLEPEELLKFLHGIEKHAKRERTVRWGPRTLDLDIIFYDKMVYESDDLIIPHADMHNRLFVLQPLMELCPNYRHPLLGKTVEQLYTELKKKDI